MGASKDRDGYKRYYYYKNHSNREHPCIPKSKSFNIIRDFNREILDAMIFDSYIFKIPYIGTLKIVKYKSISFKDGKFKGYAKDEKLSKQYKKDIYHTNEHTNVYVFRFNYKPYSNYKNSKYYTLKMRRYDREYFAKILKNKDKYPPVDAYLI